MKRVNALVACLCLGLLVGCAQQPVVDDLEPMPASTADTDDPGLANGMPEPAPETPAADAADAGDSSQTADNSVQKPQTLWQHLRQGFALDLKVDNRRVKAQRDWYLRHPAYLQRVETRAERYLDYIVNQADERNIPTELALLPIVESAFDPFAYSHGRASGPWQFIPSTGRHFGLKQDYWYDGRRDIKASTNAAFDYLQKLSERFDGDWLLALASYNAGAGIVARAVHRNKRRGRPTDFWHLHLPRETSAYVPKLIAIAQIIQDPDKYGITLKKIPNRPYFQTVDVDGQIDLAKAAKMADISLEELYMLNPGYNRWATPPDGPFHLLIPVKHVDQFEKALDNMPDDQLMAWDHYHIRPGDSLITIARQYHTTPEVLRQMNHLHGNTIIAGHDMLVPHPSNNMSQYSLSKNSRRDRRQNISVPGRKQSHYRVSHGDTLWDIAQSHHVSVRQLARWNNMAPADPLHPGQKLVIWTRYTHPSSRPGIPQMIRKVRYSVHRGDSLYRIASRFNVSVHQIQRWNSINVQKYLHPGQHLTLYVDIRNAY